MVIWSLFIARFNRVRSCTKVFQHCIEKKKHSVRNSLIFTIDASLWPLIHYVHISLCFTRTVVTGWNPYTRVTLQLYRELTVLGKRTGLHSLNTWLGYVKKTKQDTAAPCGSAPVTHPANNDKRKMCSNKNGLLLLYNIDLLFEIPPGRKAESGFQFKTSCLSGRNPESDLQHKITKRHKTWSHCRNDVTQIWLKKKCKVITAGEKI